MAECLWGPSGGLSVCHRHTEYDYPELYYFDAVDTYDYNCCYVGIQNDGVNCEPGTDIGTEPAQGRHCGYGCVDCDDGGVDGGFGMDQYEFIDGQRWLMPSVLPGHRHWDARGMIHDLLSNEYHPIPGRIIYERGTCFQNDGVECFGADACACFGDNTFPDEAGGGAAFCGGEGGVPIGALLPGLLPDEFFRTGYRWPPNQGVAGGQGNETWYCRQFGDTRLPVEQGGHTRSTVTVAPIGIGGLNGVTESMMEPALLSSNVCQSDRLADCNATLASSSPCYYFSAHGICTRFQSHETCSNQFYSGDDHRDFDELKIDRDNDTDPPRIITSDTDHSRIGGATAAWKNMILEIVRTHLFPLPPEPGGAERTISFGGLDHMAKWLGNPYVGFFKREWIATEDTLVKVPDGSGTGRLRQAGCVFDYSTWITRVLIVCRLILQQHQRGDPSAPSRKSIVPLVRLHIIATTTITIDNLHSPCSFVSARDGLPVDLEVVNEWANDEYTPVLSTDYGESFIFLNADGRQFIPSPFVEWRGFLGGHSKPTSVEETVGMAQGLYQTCEEIAENFSATVPGWPTNVDTPGGPDLDDPAGTYGGHVHVEFA